MASDVLYIIPLITRVLAKTKKILFTIYLLPAFVVLFNREIVSQRRWCRLATEDAGVDKLPDYLRSDTSEKQLDSSHCMLSNGELSKIIHHLKLWRAMQVNGAFNSIEKSNVINNDSLIHYSIFNVTQTIRRSLPIPTTECTETSPGNADAAAVLQPRCGVQPRARNVSQWQ